MEYTKVSKYENKVIYAILVGVVCLSFFSLYSTFGKKNNTENKLEKIVQDKTLMSGLKR